MRNPNRALAHSWMNRPVRVLNATYEYLGEVSADRAVVLIATGSEVHLALECAAELEKQGVGADVVSMVCTQLFDEQDDAYKADLLPDVSPSEVLRVSIEAGTTFGWDRYTMTNGLRIGIDRFGASAPAEDLFAKFGLTVDAIVPQIMNKLNA